MHPPGLMPLAYPDVQTHSHILKQYEIKKSPTPFKAPPTLNTTWALALGGKILALILLFIFIALI